MFDYIQKSMKNGNVKSNKKLGNDFEREFCDTLSQKGFWCYNLPSKIEGQPFDVIACYKGKTFVVDCKVCKNDNFTFDRVEDNQRSAMTKFYECGNGWGFFAMKTSEDVFMVQAGVLFRWMDTQITKSLSLNFIKSIGKPLNKWADEIRSSGLCMC